MNDSISEDLDYENDSSDDKVVNSIKSGDIVKKKRIILRFADGTYSHGMLETIDNFSFTIWGFWFLAWNET